MSGGYRSGVAATSTARDPAHQFAQRGSETGLQRRGAKSVGELSELIDGRGDLGHRPVEGLARLTGIGPDLVLGVAQRQADGDQALLRAVVQVALETPALLVGHRGKPGSRRLHLL